MKKYTAPIETDTYYHIFNRGINGETLFKEEKNYHYFLEKFEQHLTPIVDTYAYCLLGNHFHMLIRTKSEEELIQFHKPKNDVPLSDIILKEPNRIISKQFATLFKTYTLAINKAFLRTGGLFETPFRRIPITNDAYFTRLVWYIHFNPQKHGFIDDFRNYPYSSFHSHLYKKSTQLKRADVLEWFGNKDEYLKFHNMQHEEEKYLVEFDYF